ncbi:MAG: hypothetical protein LBH06_02095 [Rikenellaceae bacterium]|jgi:hypothetical protein|nr:hypothetical protein [Rikenellaceae bacterium]
MKIKENQCITLPGHDDSYVAPAIELIDLVVEKGFIGSGGGATLPRMGDDPNEI